MNPFDLACPILEKQAWTSQHNINVTILGVFVLHIFLSLSLILINIYIYIHILYIYIHSYICIYLFEFAKIDPQFSTAENSLDLLGFSLSLSPSLAAYTSIHAYVCVCIYISYTSACLCVYLSTYMYVSTYVRGCRRNDNLLLILTHRLQSSSVLGSPYRILNMNPKKELLWGLWVGAWVLRVGLNLQPKASLKRPCKAPEALDPESPVPLN